ncbi:YceI family protein [Actinomadura flavalba]|uniref:YceI family protein n=1 Tax=Actinomadura flavalba TaxID=1120938 RepID=UPI000475A17E|nr:YceI family protein [Actinomadura flavalba]
MADATHALGPDDGTLLVRTGRAGLGRKAGHDLTLEATRWSAEVTLGATATVEVRVPVEGLLVKEGTGGVLPLSDADRAEILLNLRKTLRPEHAPDIVFRAADVAPDAQVVTGDLTIKERTEPLEIRTERTGDRLTGAATVRQTRWGIKPYSAFLGALKLADDVEVTFDVALPAS